MMAPRAGVPGGSVGARGAEVSIVGIDPEYIAAALEPPFTLAWRDRAWICASHAELRALWEDLPDAAFFEAVLTARKRAGDGQAVPWRAPAVCAITPRRH